MIGGSNSNGMVFDFAALLSRNWGEIQPRSLLITNRKSNIGFRLEQKSMTLNGQNANATSRHHEIIRYRRKVRLTSVLVNYLLYLLLKFWWCPRPSVWPYSLFRVNIWLCINVCAFDIHVDGQQYLLHRLLVGQQPSRSDSSTERGGDGAWRSWHDHCCWLGSTPVRQVCHQGSSQVRRLPLQSTRIYRPLVVIRFWQCDLVLTALHVEFD